MERRVAVFLWLSVLLVLGQIWFVSWMNPPEPEAPGEGAPAEAGADGAANAGDPAAPAEAPAAEDVAEGAAPAVQPAAEEDLPPPQRYTLGSLDPASGYRMLVTFTNVGAAMEMAELNNGRLHDLDDLEHFGGYLGHLAADAAAAGAVVQVVGPGTPAAAAGLQVGDVLTQLDVPGHGPQPITGPLALDLALRLSRPGQTATLSYVRDGQPQQVAVTLAQRPLPIVSPEADDQLSYLLTLNSFGEDWVADGQEELPDFKLRSQTWNVIEHDADTIVFERRLVAQQLAIRKRFELVQAGPDDIATENAPVYHLTLTIELENLAPAGEAETQLAYRLDGPTGLPTECWWYANKIGRHWTGGPGTRDIAMGWWETDFVYHDMVSGVKIADEDVGGPWTKPLIYLGVDAQYFLAALIPQHESPDKTWVASYAPLRVGAVPANAREKELTNVSFRLISQRQALPAGATLSHGYRLFLGPKRPALLAQYELDGSLYYGWFGWTSRPLSALLHFFYSIVPNYGIAIILLTICVRMLMFPLSRKQALNAQKMQELQPEIKRLAERYKNNLEQRTKAQQELFRKHNYSPFSGCLPIFIQLPVFIGLYRSLSLDVELREAPLFWHGFGWADNLAAPDMLWYWKPFLPGFLASETGWLGPYFNILPLATVAIFLWQQKLLMPPATDEQTAAQQKMMKFMTIFMGVMFFKVASGLCLYFICSSLWGIAERKLLPKTLPAKNAPESGSDGDDDDDGPAASPAPGGNGARRKDRRPARR